MNEYTITFSSNLDNTEYTYEIEADSLDDAIQEAKEQLITYLFFITRAN